MTLLWFIAGMMIGWFAVDHLYAWVKYYRDQREFEERYYGRYADYVAYHHKEDQIDD